MRYFDAGEARIYHEVAGDGPPLLLIAGIASDVASWAPIVPLLQSEFRLVMFDNRGAGRTRHSGPIDPQDWISDAVGLLDHLGIERAHIIGHSLGGMIGLRIVQAVPDRVGKLVAAATTGRPEAKSAALLGEMASLYENGMQPEAWFRLLFQWLFAPPFFDDPARVAEAGRMSAAYEYCQSPADFRRQVEAVKLLPETDLASIRSEFLLLSAENDAMIPPGASRASFATAPKLRETVIAQAGHSLHWDQPQAFAKAVIEFLKC